MVVVDSLGVEDLSYRLLVLTVLYATLNQVIPRVKVCPRPKASYVIDLFTDSDAILKILSVDFCGKVKVNSDSSSKIV